MRRKGIVVLACLTLIAAVCLFGCGETPHAHVMDEVALVPSTCEEQGTAAHYKCKDCKKLFTDADGKNETMLSALTLELAGHTFVKYGKGVDVHWQTCKVCGTKSDSEAHKFEAVKICEPTATSDGYDRNGEACLACGYGKDGLKVKPKTTPFTSETHDGLGYCLYDPVAVEGFKVPLVLFLHGSGERGTDNVAQLKNAICEVVKHNAVNEYMESVVIVPQCPNNVQWVSAPWSDGNYTLASVPESDPMKQVVKLVEYYAEKPYIDTSRIYVMGVSMGGFGAWDLLARHSNLFAAGVPMCGGAPTDAVDVLKDMPVYTFHSKNDASVPFKGTDDIVKAIKAAGGTKINFVVYEDKGHNMWNDAIVHDGLEQWLFAQSK